MQTNDQHADTLSATCRPPEDFIVDRLVVSLRSMRESAEAQSAAMLALGAVVESNSGVRTRLGDYGVCGMAASAVTRFAKSEEVQQCGLLCVGARGRLLACHRSHEALRGEPPRAGGVSQSTEPCTWRGKASSTHHMKSTTPGPLCLAGPASL
jgi:hypothetical protein